MADALQQRSDEKKIYEELVNVIVDTAALHYPEDEAARLRIYEKVAENFAGMVRSLRKPESLTLEQKHMAHYQFCNCLADTSVCCNPDCCIQEEEDAV